MRADWISELRAACDGSTQKAIAARIGYSATVVNQVLLGKYKGDLLRIKSAVEGALMQHEVECPVCGLIPRERCIAHQRRPFTATNPASVRLFRACRGDCPHSLIGAARGEKS
jgi:DNA-binding transcriptional regulator YdaS (Cro superfamily)